MNLLQQHELAMAERREQERLSLLQKLRGVLARLLPGEKVWLYGSILQKGRFTEWSDIDLALEKCPDHLSLYGLPSLISEEVDRRIDLVILNETRLEKKIRREGELWTL